MRILERNVKGRVGRFMRKRGWAAFTLPIPVVGCAIFYWLLDDETEPPMQLVRHEFRHAMQIERLGAVRFAVTYLYYLARYSYRANPFEIDARMAEEGRDA